MIQQEKGMPKADLQLTSRIEDLQMLFQDKRTHKSNTIFVKIQNTFVKHEKTFVNHGNTFVNYGKTFVNHGNTFVNIGNAFVNLGNTFVNREIFVDIFETNFSPYSTSVQIANS